MATTVLVTRRPPGSAIERLASVATVDVWPHDREMDRDALVAGVAGVEGLYCMLTDRIDAEVIDAAPALRVVSTMAVGVDHIDLDACRSRGIAVGHTPGVLTDATADMAFALLMAASRRVPEAADWVASGRWQRWEPNALLGSDVSRSVIGIVGMGRIGTAVALRARGFGMDIRYASRSAVPEVEARTGARRMAFGELLGFADHVVVCVPLTQETMGMFDRAALAAMKPTATLVNVARGPIVDTEALVAALAGGVIRCAALDVTDPEPLPSDHPLVGMANCLVVPHIGSATVQARTAMADLAAENLVAGLAGDEMPARIA